MPNFGNLKKYMTQRNMLVVGVALAAVFYYLHINNMMPPMIQSGGEADKKITVVLFYAPWCPHCKDIMPMWKKLVEKHSSDNKVEVKKVNCEDKPEQAEQNDVQGFPTIIMFKNGKKVKYEGERTEEGIENFISGN
jgi:protein disulfide-isomerase-like protein